MRNWNLDERKEQDIKRWETPGVWMCGLLFTLFLTGCSGQSDSAETDRFSSAQTVEIIELTTSTEEKPESTAIETEPTTDSVSVAPNAMQDVPESEWKQAYRTFLLSEGCYFLTKLHEGIKK